MGTGKTKFTQSLKHFGGGDDDFSKYILTWVVHNVSDLKSSDIRFVFTVDRFRVVFNLNDTITLLEFRNVSKQLLFLLAVGFRIEDKAYVAVL